MVFFYYWAMAIDKTYTKFIQIIKLRKMLPTSDKSTETFLTCKNNLFRQPKHVNPIQKTIFANL